MKTEEIIERFAKEAMAHGRATDAGNHKSANRAYDRAVKAFRELRQTPEGERALLPLLEHENPYVRAWAAVRLLAVEEKRAVAVLEAVSRGKGFMAISAGMSLELWKKGELELP